MKRMCSHFLTEKVKNQNKFDELPYFLPFRKAIAFGSATSSYSVEWSHSILSTFPKETNFFKTSIIKIIIHNIYHIKKKQLIC